MRERIRLADSIKDCSKEESRAILKGFYDKYYQNGKYAPRNGAMMWEKLLLSNPQFLRGLDVGCGTGIGMRIGREHGYNLWGIDLANASSHWRNNKVADRCCIASATHLPFPDNFFDFVMSFDTLEHILEGDIPTTLQEIKRVASRVILLVVSLLESRELIDGIECHVTVKPKEWWTEQIERTGFCNPMYIDSEHHLTAWLFKA